MVDSSDNEAESIRAEARPDEPDTNAPALNLAKSFMRAGIHDSKAVDPF